MDVSAEAAAAVVPLWVPRTGWPLRCLNRQRDRIDFCKACSLFWAPLSMPLHWTCNAMVSLCHVWVRGTFIDEWVDEAGRSSLHLLLCGGVEVNYYWNCENKATLIKENPLNFFKELFNI